MPDVTGAPERKSDAVEQLSAALAGRYAVERELGRGGMATVYLARDLRHDRWVAVKVLHAELAAVIGAERFLAEIRTTAGLQHPHILPLFDSGETTPMPGNAPGTRQLYYVMPFVDGETLRARLDRERQLPVDDALRLARDVASALDYAHRHGVIHRDVKPANILLHDGQVQVADFGIALAVSKAGGERMTQSGMSLGTPQYMSPEQATGERHLDARADVYALGAVLYEMLAGEPPFMAPTLQGIVARVLSEEARRLVSVRRSVPRHVDAAVAQALEKLPADRFASAAAFAAALSPPSSHSALGDDGRSAATAPGGAGTTADATSARAAARHGPATPRALRWRQWLPWVVATIGFPGGLWLGRRTAPRTDAQVARFSVVLPTDLRLITARPGNLRHSLAISPDGSRLVLVAVPPNSDRSHLFLRPLDRTELTPIPGTDGAEQPFFSPNGEWVGFIQDGKLRKVPLAGGPPVTIADANFAMRGASWGPGDVIVVTRQYGPLLQTSADGGPFRRVATPDTVAAESFNFPQILPDGKTVLATLSVPQGEARVVAVSLESGDTVTVIDDVSTGRYVPHARGGHLVFVRTDGTVMAAPFDVARLRLTGPAVPVGDSAQVFAGGGFANVAVAANGTIAYQPGTSTKRELVIREADGTISVLPAGQHDYRSPRFSPDGRRIAVGVAVGSNDVLSDIWVYDLEHETFSRLTFDGRSSFPEFTPDGKSVIYASLVRPDDRELLRISTNGGTPDTLLVLSGQQHEGAVTPDGRTLVFRQVDPRTGRDLWAVPLGRPADGRSPQRRSLAVTPFDERSLALSPDGQWLAYQSDASGRHEVYVRPLADATERWQVSPGGGGEPRWDRRGGTIYFRNADTLFSVAVTTSPTFRLGGRRTLFTATATTDVRTAYDVSPDGRRFVFLRDLERSRPDEIRVVLEALDERR